MAPVKLIAINTIHLPTGVAKRPRRIDGRIVMDANGKVIEEEVTVVATIKPNDVFVLDDEEIFGQLKAAKAVKLGGEDDKITFVLGTEKIAAPKPARVKKAAAPTPDASGDNEDLV